MGGAWRGVGREEGGAVLLVARLVFVPPPPSPAPPVKSSSSGGMDGRRATAGISAGTSLRNGIHSVQEERETEAVEEEEEVGGVCVAMGEGKGGRGGDGGPQNDSSCPTERSPLGVEARDEPLSMLSEPELWCCCSEAALDVMVDEEVEEERLFSLKSVMITVTLPTVMASCWAVLRSTFFSLGLEEEERRAVRTVESRSSWTFISLDVFLFFS